MSTLATTNIKHESASTPNITLTSGGATTVNGTLNLGSSPLVTPTGSAPSYTCRAWVNFNGTGTVAIRASGNVSSITDNGTGDYTVNFTTAMPDTNYAVNGTTGISSGTTYTTVASPANNASPFSGTKTVSAVSLTVSNIAAVFDAADISVSIFR